MCSERTSRARSADTPATPTNCCGSRMGSTTSTPPVSCCTRQPTRSCTARTADSSPPSSTRPAGPTAAPRRSRPTAPPTSWPTCSAWTPATPPSGTSQAGQPPPLAATPTPRRSPPRSAAPRPPSCTPSTPSPRRSAWTTEIRPAGLPRPLPSRAGPRAAAQRPLPRHTGRHHPLPTTASTPYPRRPRCDRERGAAGAAPVGASPYVANIKNTAPLDREATVMTGRTAGTNTLNLCAGPGGWETGALLLDSSPVITGFDVSADACATARAAGYHRIQSDVRSLEPADFPDITGLIVSPPCPTFSSSGLRSALSGDDYQDALDAITCLSEGCSKTWHHLPSKVSDPRTALVVETARWVLRWPAVKWVIAEQVPSVELLWEDLAAELAAAGWEYMNVETIDAHDLRAVARRRRTFLLGCRYRRRAHPL